MHQLSRRSLSTIQKHAAKAKFSAAAAVAFQEQQDMARKAQQNTPFFQSEDRHQAFVSAASLNLEMNRNNPPIIQPQFHHPGQFVMDPSKYSIDCSKFDTNTINASNSALSDEMQSKFHDTGLVYLHNTSLTDLQSMRQLVSILIPSEMNMEYKGGSNWRNYIEPNVYDTGAPAQAWIHYHHEMAYIATSPQSLAFMAKSALPNGRGATYVSDQVQVTDALLDTPFGQKLREKKICYVRCLTDERHYAHTQQDEHDVYNHWQKSFGTEDPDAAEAAAKERGLAVEWEWDHKRYGRYMKTKFYTDVYEYFPLLDKNILYASVADHWMWFDAWPGVQALDNLDRPIRITYGDDSAMTQDELKQFVDVYDKYGIGLKWKQGDIAIMCNYRWAHGRPVYELEEGEERELGVVLGSVFDRQGQRDDKF